MLAPTGIVLLPANLEAFSPGVLILFYEFSDVCTFPGRAPLFPPWRTSHASPFWTPPVPTSEFFAPGKQPGFGIWRKEHQVLQGWDSWVEKFRWNSVPYNVAAKKFLLRVQNLSSPLGFFSRFPRHSRIHPFIPNSTRTNPVQTSLSFRLNEEGLGIPSFLLERRFLDILLRPSRKIGEFP